MGDAYVYIVNCYSSCTICATEYYGLALIGLHGSGFQGEVVYVKSVEFVFALSGIL